MQQGDNCLYLPCCGSEALLLWNAMEGQAPELLHADWAGCQLLLKAPQPCSVRGAASRRCLLRACKQAHGAATARCHTCIQTRSREGQTVKLSVAKQKFAQSMMQGGEVRGPACISKRIALGRACRRVGTAAWKWGWCCTWGSIIPRQGVPVCIACMQAMLHVSKKSARQYALSYSRALATHPARLCMTCQDRPGNCLPLYHKSYESALLPCRLAEHSG